MRHLMAKTLRRLATEVHLETLIGGAAPVAFSAFSVDADLGGCSIRPSSALNGNLGS